MASRTKRHRSGHPAKLAERQQRERARREGSRDPLRRAASTFVREAAALETALEAELWASLLLGTLWANRELLADAEDADTALGAPLLGELARLGDEGALAALIALGEVAETSLGPIALGHAERLEASGVRPPRWADAIREAEILGVAAMREDVYDDGITILIEARHGDDASHTLGVYIDHNLGGIAKDILMAESIELVAATVRAETDRHEIRIEPMAQAEACARIHDAIDLTDTSLGAPVGEDFTALRALALLRAAQLPGPPVDATEPEIAPAERSRLLADFLASPEGAGFAPDSDEAYVTTLAIDYACGYQVGGPLRWSPVVVELFMAGWLPHKVIADRATFEAVPRSLGAWVRYAGRHRGIPEWAVDETVASIDNWTEEMLELIEDPESRGPTVEFLDAARHAGIDLADRAALATFIAGWNARSDLS